MNIILMEEIIKHIFANLSIVKSNFINHDKTKSLNSKDFLLSEKLIFETDTGELLNNIWGCQISSEQQELKILLGDCAQGKDYYEYCLIVQLKNSPSYGLYIIYNGENQDSEPLIACSLNGKDWMECNTFLQATFLAGMEQIKDIGLSWSKCINYKDQYELMLSFIKYHEILYEDKYARKKI